MRNSISKGGRLIKYKGVVVSIAPFAMLAVATSVSAGTIGLGAGDYSGQTLSDTGTDNGQIAYSLGSGDYTFGDVNITEVGTNHSSSFATGFYRSGAGETNIVGNVLMDVDSTDRNVLLKIYKNDAVINVDAGASLINASDNPISYYGSSAITFWGTDTNVWEVNVDGKIESENGTAILVGDQKFGAIPSWGAGLTVNQSETGEIIADDFAIMSTDSDDILTLNGYVSGNIQTYGGDDTVTIGGVVEGNINLGNGDDHIQISGSHVGVVTLGSGEDVFDLTGNMNGGVNTYDGSFDTLNFTGVDVSDVDLSVDADQINFTDVSGGMDVYSVGSNVDSVNSDVTIMVGSNSSFNAINTNNDTIAFIGQIDEFEYEGVTYTYQSSINELTSTGSDVSIVDFTVVDLTTESGSLGLDGTTVTTLDTSSTALTSNGSTIDMLDMQSGTIASNGSTIETANLESVTGNIDDATITTLTANSSDLTMAGGTVVDLTTESGSLGLDGTTVTTLDTSSTALTSNGSTIDMLDMQSGTIASNGSTIVTANLEAVTGNIDDATITTLTANSSDLTMAGGTVVDLTTESGSLGLDGTTVTALDASSTQVTMNDADVVTLSVMDGTLEASNGSIGEATLINTSARFNGDEGTSIGSVSAINSNVDLVSGSIAGTSYFTDSTFDMFSQTSTGDLVFDNSIGNLFGDAVGSVSASNNSLVRIGEDTDYGDIFIDENSMVFLNVIPEGIADSNGNGMISTVSGLGAFHTANGVVDDITVGNINDAYLVAEARETEADYTVSGDMIGDVDIYVEDTYNDAGDLGDLRVIKVEGDVSANLGWLGDTSTYDPFVSQGLAVDGDYVIIERYLNSSATAYLDSFSDLNSEFSWADLSNRGQKITSVYEGKHDRYTQGATFEFDAFNVSGVMTKNSYAQDFGIYLDHSYAMSPNITIESTIGGGYSFNTIDTVPYFEIGSQMSYQNQSDVKAYALVAYRQDGSGELFDSATGSTITSGKTKKSMAEVGVGYKGLMVYGGVNDTKSSINLESISGHEMTNNIGSYDNYFGAKYDVDFYGTNIGVYAEKSEHFDTSVGLNISYGF